MGSNSRPARGTLTCIEASRAEAETQGHGAEGNEGCRRKATTIPLSSWIGKQLIGQNIPKRHLDKDGKLMLVN
jgi:hypothetical protein